MSLTVAPLPGKTFGAAITGKKVVEFSELDWATVHRAFLDYGLLIFPGQFANPTIQAEFALKFGAIERLILRGPHRLKPVPMGNVTGKKLWKAIIDGKSHEEISAGAELVIDPLGILVAQQNEEWHIDSTYMAVSAKAGTLNTVEMPEVGGETGFADAAAAYDSLDVGLRQRIDDLQAYHSQHFSFMYEQKRELFPLGASYGWNGDAFLHNVVKTHPETGRKSIYVGRHAFRIKGMDRATSEELIQKLNQHVVSDPSRVYEHKWAPGDLGIWDNRRMYHRAQTFDVRQRRLLLGIRVSGDESERCIPSDENSKAILDEEMVMLRRERGVSMKVPFSEMSISKL